MSYADLSQDDQVLLAISFVAANTEIPFELRTILGPEIVADILNPIGETDEKRLHAEGLSA